MIDEDIEAIRRIVRNAVAAKTMCYVPAPLLSDLIARLEKQPVLTHLHRTHRLILDITINADSTGIEEIKLIRDDNIRNEVKND